MFLKFQLSQHEKANALPAIKEGQVLSRNDIRSRYKALGFMVPPDHLIDDLFLCQTQMFRSERFNNESKVIQTSAELIGLIRRKSESSVAAKKDNRKEDKKVEANPVLALWNSVIFTISANKNRNRALAKRSKHRCAPAGF
jgi:hypothetical protein